MLSRQTDILDEPAHPTVKLAQVGGSMGVCAYAAGLLLAWGFPAYSVGYLEVLHDQFNEGHELVSTRLGEGIVRRHGNPVAATAPEACGGPAHMNSATSWLHPAEAATLYRAFNVYVVGLNVTVNALCDDLTAPPIVADILYGVVNDVTDQVRDLDH